MTDWLKVIGFVALLAVSVWATCYAPCDFYRYAAGSDIPGRCLMAGR